MITNFLILLNKKMNISKKVRKVQEKEYNLSFRNLHNPFKSSAHKIRNNLTLMNKRKRRLQKNKFMNKKNHVMKNFFLGS